MPWLVLVGSAVLEAVWAVALGRSVGLTLWVPTLVFLVATTLSMVGLWWAVRSIPVGTAYAVWTGLGAGFTAAYSWIFGGEDASPLKVLFLVGVVGAAVGLKLVAPGQVGGARGTPDEETKQ